MKDLIPKEIVDTFKLLYADVNDIDLFIAGISERPAHGAILGPTFQVMCFSCKESKKQAAVKNKAVIYSLPCTEQLTKSRNDRDLPPSEHVIY